MTHSTSSTAHARPRRGIANAHWLWLSALVIAVDQFTKQLVVNHYELYESCLLYTSPSPRDKRQSRMPSSA